MLYNITIVHVLTRNNYSDGYSLLKYSIFLVEPSLRMGDLNADASASSKPPISSSAHSISTMDRMAMPGGDRYIVTRRAVGDRR